VDRNRIKRCIREAFRLEQETIADLDVLVRPPYGVRGSPAMLARLRELLRALK
jgi:ribonuclease P protein component